MDLRELSQEPFCRHPWEVARFRFFSAIVRAHLVPRGAATFLDVGAGDGWFARELAAQIGTLHQITCWDSGYDRDTCARLRAMSDHRVTYRSDRPVREPFDAVLLLDVLEHVEDDAALLRALVAENLAPAGAVLVSVPAWPALYGPHDAALKHYRRYWPGALRDLVRRCGLKTEIRGGLFHSLLVPRIVQRMRERWIEAPGNGADAPDELRWNHAAWLRRLVDGALRVDNGFSRLAASAGVTIPGLSAWALCRRSS
jgi:SAM-dependent methyltransferase